jgi:23S rRNA (adenine1618-N6)-methyltransferase
VHPRNPHQGHYDFKQLTKACPDLAAFVSKNPYGALSIDFADPHAVKTLNRALLQHFYEISHWKIPEGYLCPPVPGRADSIHHIADLLAGSHDGVIPRGRAVRVLDIGVGANCIYPLIGHREYGWSFVGSDIDAVALAAAKWNVESNPCMSGAIELRLQKSRSSIFKNLLGGDETFEVSICNPPFHASPEEAAAGSRRKWLGLGKKPGRAPALNFGGGDLELWCEGGEIGFVRRMIEESALIPARVRWFTSLVSKEANLPAIYRALEKVGVWEVKTLELAQGQKKSRIVGWSFR